jgi:hypothetical protein
MHRLGIDDTHRIHRGRVSRNDRRRRWHIGSDGVEGYDAGDVEGGK